MEWISVNDEFPEMNETNVVFGRDSGLLIITDGVYTTIGVCTYFSQSGESKFCDNFDDSIFDGATHWMYVPDLPKLI